MGIFKVQIKWIDIKYFLYKKRFFFILENTIKHSFTYKKCKNEIEYKDGAYN